MFTFEKQTFRKAILALACAIGFTAGADTVKTDLISLRGNSVPSSCALGQIMRSSSDGKIKFCNSGTYADFAVLVGGVLPVANGGTGLASGTSGGILAYTASGTLASSGVLAANQVVIGGGAGVAPSTLAAGSQYQVLRMGAANPAWGSIDLSQSAAVTGILPNANTTATSANTNSAIVARDGSGNFSAGTITAALSGNASTATALAANPADCASDTYATTIAASGALTCATVTNAGLAGSIAFSKMVDLTADRILASDVNGDVSVTSIPKANLPKSVAAYVSYSAGTPAMTQEKGGDWVSSITDGGTGLPQLNLTGSFFTTAPICTCSSEENVASGQACMVNSFSTSAINIRTRDLAGTLVDGNVHVHCQEYF